MKHLFIAVWLIVATLAVYPQVTSSGEAAYQRGRALVDAKNYIGAMVELKEAIRLDPRHAMAFHYVGIAQYYLKDYVVANAAFERALQLNVANPHFAYMWIGDIQRVQGQYDKARSAYREAVRVKPDYADAFNNIGLTYHLQKDYPNAVLFFEQAARLAPSVGLYRKNIGVAYIGAGKKDEAMKVYNSLVPIDAKLAGELLDEITKPATAALTKTPAETSFDNGVKLYNAKDYQKALASFQEALQFKPDFGDASHYLGMALYQLKQYPAAITAFENALKLNIANSHFSKEWIGDIYKELKEYDKAIAAYADSLKLKPTLSQPAQKIGNVYYSLKRYPEAAAAYQNAIKIEPGRAGNHASLGDVYYYAQKDYEKAVTAFREAVRLDAKYDYAMNMLGMSYYMLKRYAEALTAFDAAVKLKPDNLLYLQNLGYVHVELGEKLKAMDVAQKLAIRDKTKSAELLSYLNKPPEPKTAEEFVARGEKLLAEKEYDEALDAFQKATQLKPDLFSAQKGLGAAYAANYLPTQSLAAYEKALALKPNDPDVYYGIAVAKRGLLKLDEAIAAFQKCIELKPKGDVLIEAHFALGEFFMILRPKDALAEFQQVQRLKPNYPKLQLNIAKAQYNDRQYATALPFFLEGLKKTPDDAELVYYAGMCYVRLGKKPEAEAMYEKLNALGAPSAGNLKSWIKGMK